MSYPSLPVSVCFIRNLTQNETETKKRGMLPSAESFLTVSQKSSDSRLLSNGVSSFRETIEKGGLSCLLLTIHVYL